MTPGSQGIPKGLKQGPHPNCWGTILGPLGSAPAECIERYHPPALSIDASAVNPGSGIRELLEAVTSVTG